MSERFAAVSEMVKKQIKCGNAYRLLLSPRQPQGTGSAGVTGNRPIRGATSRQSTAQLYTSSARGKHHGTIVMQRERSSAIASLILLPLLFWGAKVLICIGTGREPHWLFMTVAMLGVLAVSAFFLDRVFAFSARHYLLALSDIYLLGPSMMIMCNTFTGGGVHTLQGRDFWWIPVFSVFPPYTLIMSSYDLTLVPLTISTLWLAGLAAYKWRLKNVIHGPAPAVPPSN